MYRQRIRDYYDHLSRSYRKVADFIMSNYYEVSFMTAAQLAFAVGVDTTTVVRFSQRLGYNGYPELLHDIRDQVRQEIYATYDPQPLAPDDPASLFKASAEQEQHNISQMLVHNPPEQIETAAQMLADARHILLIGEGYATTIAVLAAQQLRHRGLSAEAAGTDPGGLAGTLAALAPGTLVVGVNATPHGRDVARAMQFARARGCPTLGVVGSLSGPVNRMSDLVVYAPSESSGPLPTVVALVAALSALVRVARRETDEEAERYAEAFDQTYDFLLQGDAPVPEEEEPA
jgi:DNA-binding MurR/RpiR family transcriptional regulator